MVNEIQLGEIVRIKDREFILTERAIGGSDKLRPILILLNNILKTKTNKKRFAKVSGVYYLKREYLINERSKGLKKLSTFKTNERRRKRKK
jgi:hypothetical protein